MKRNHSDEDDEASTVIELLAVLVILGVVAVLVVPTFHSLHKPDALQAASSQLLGAVSRARQMAISQGTTVYMVFVPPDFWNDPPCSSNLAPGLTENDRTAFLNLSQKQLAGYNYLVLHGKGDQPGTASPRYLSAWQTLPDGIFIAEKKFEMMSNEYFTVTDVASPEDTFRIYGFNSSTRLPFPTAETKPYSPAQPYVKVPYIAFNYLGQLTTFESSPQAVSIHECIPLAVGSVIYAKDPVTKAPIMAAASAMELPPGNSTNSYHAVQIDWMTGRAALKRHQVQ